jgi:fructose-bisphosphate aldolase class I
MEKQLMENKLLRDEEALALIAEALVAPGKGILAADESDGTITKRFNNIGVDSTAENRRAYRELLFTSPNIEEAISGVILYDETIHQTASDKRTFPRLLLDSNILPGIKVDKGKIDMPGFAPEKITEGLDGLSERLIHYRKLGAVFAKWRAVFTIDRHLPTHTCIHANAHALARYAALCQHNGIVPIVEPEVLMEGTHEMERCEVVTGAVLQAVFAELLAQGVIYEGMLLKPNMVLPGKDSEQFVTPEQVAEATLRCFRRVVPAAVPGIVFLSGGQTSQEATERLNAMNKVGNQPWELSFSFGRALQQPVLQAWQVDTAEGRNPQQVFYQQAKNNSAARLGRYERQMEAG